MPAAATITDHHVHVSARKMEKNKEKVWHIFHKRKKGQIHRCLPYISDDCNYKIQTSLTARQVRECHSSMDRLLYWTESVLLVKGEKDELILYRIFCIG